MTTLAELRQNVSAFQRALLDQIATAYLETEKGPIARVLHLKHGKADVMDALRRLGGCIVFEAEDYQSGHRYQPTFLGLLLTSKGPEYQRLLGRYLTYVEARVLAEPEWSEVKSTDVRASLQVSEAESALLYRLLSLGHIFGRSSTCGPDRAVWQAGVPNEVDDLPSWKSKDEFVEHIALQKYDPKMPVYAADRRAYGVGGPVPRHAERPDYVEKWTKWLLSHKLVAALVLGFTILVAVAGGLSSMRDAFWPEAKSAPARDYQRRRLTEEQIERVAGVLAAGPKCSVQILWPGGDPPAESLARDIDRLLGRATFPRTQLSWFDRATTDEGIFIRLPKTDGRRDVAQSLQAALKLAGLESVIEVNARLGLEAPYELQIYVAH